MEHEILDFDSTEDTWVHLVVVSLFKDHYGPEEGGGPWERQRFNPVDLYDQPLADLFRFGYTEMPKDLAKQVLPLLNTLLAICDKGDSTFRVLAMSQLPQIGETSRVPSYE